MEIGGAEIFAIRLLNYLSQHSNHKFGLLILSTNFQKEPLYERVSKNPKVKFETFRENQESWKYQMLWKLNALTHHLFNYTWLKSKIEEREKRKLQKLSNEYDLFHSFLIGSDLFSIENFGKNPINKILVTIQGCYNDHKEIREIEKIASRLDALTFVSESNIQPFHANQIALPQITEKIYNGVEIQKIHETDVSEGLFILGQVTRSIPEKGLEETIKAFDLLQKKHVDQHFQLQLVCPENDYLQSLKDKYHTIPNILFLSDERDIQSRISQFSIGLLPSYFKSESCPSTIIEYLVQGVPVIATAIGDIPSMIQFEDQLAGVLIENKQFEPIQPEDLLEKIELFLAPETRLKFRHIAFEAGEKFDLKNISKKYFAVYNQLLSTAE